MSVVRRIARPMMASMFIAGGVDQLRNPAVKPSEPVAPKVAQAINQSPAPVTLPTDPDQLVRINGAVMVGAGLMLATSRFPRLSSLALASTLLPTTVAGHPFWQAETPEGKANQRVHFFKNVSMLGGLLIAAVDTEGRESVPRATRRAAKATRREAKRAAAEARMSAKVGKRLARGKVKQGSHAGGRAVERARRTAKV